MSIRNVKILQVFKTRRVLGTWNKTSYKISFPAQTFPRGPVKVTLPNKEQVIWKPANKVVLG